MDDHKLFTGVKFNCTADTQCDHHVLHPTPPLSQSQCNGATGIELGSFSPLPLVV